MAERPDMRPPAAARLHPNTQNARRDSLAAAAPNVPFVPNAGVRLAQLVVSAQCVLGLITGINLVRGSISVMRIGAGVNLVSSQSLTTEYGVGILVCSAILVAGAVGLELPSQTPRWALALLEVVALGTTLAAHFGGGSVLGFVTIIAMGATGSALIPFGAVIGLQSGAIYLLAVHPPTYRVFAR